MTARLVPLAGRKLRKDARGATVVEFALVLPLLCTLLLGFLDLGYQAYVNSVVQGALFEAARMATVGDKTGQEIDDHILKRLKPFAAGGTIKITKKSYSDFTGVGKPEKKVGECFEDANGNGRYDTDMGSDGLGGADDVVNYEILVTYKRLVPVGSLIGLSPIVKVKSAAPVRNQPFAARTEAPVPVVCPELRKGA